MGELSVETVVVIGDILVMYAVSRRHKPISEQAPDAFDRLEEKLTTLTGRRFYGAVVDGEYRACVAIRPEDDLENLPYPTWTIPGGKYVRQKLADWERQRQTIGPTIMRMRERKDLDPSRPCIEYYRSRRELLLMAPVL
jgi:hypothetical protein